MLTFGFTSVLFTATFLAGACCGYRAVVGLAVRQDGNPSTYHHKVIVIDGQIVITGSLNFSNNADESNDENVVILNSPEIAAQYLQEFERTWADAKQPDAADMNCK